MAGIQVDGKMVAELIGSYGGDMKLPELAKRAGLPYERVRNIAYNRVKSVTENELEKISQALGVPLDFNGLSHLVEKPMSRLRIVGASSAGDGVSDHPDEDYAYVPSSIIMHDSVGWIIEGDSMSPWLLPGDIVIVRPHRVPRVGYAMLVRGEDGGCKVKMVGLDGANIVLKSLNPKYPDIPASVEVLGYVTGRYRQIDGYELTESQRDGLKPMAW